MMPISKEEIEERIKCGTLCQHESYSGHLIEPREKHIDRIAWFVVNGWGDSRIVVDFGLDWILYDGNHRFGAAIYRGDEMVWAEVYGKALRIRELYAGSV